MEDEVITPEQFNDQLNELTLRTVTMLASKAGEYATDSNRYHNFAMCKMLAGMAINMDAKLTIPQMIWFLCIKHVASCMDIIRHIATERKLEVEYIDEKFGDFINYLFLMWIFIRVKYSKGE